MMLLALTGPQALATTKARLLDFDVKGPFRVQRLGRFGVGGRPDGWSSVVTTQDGTAYEAYLGANGRFASVRRNGSGPSGRGGLAGDPARVARWLGKVRPRFSVRLQPDPFGQNVYRYEATVGGYPFVDSPYGYRFTLNQGRFTGFEARERLPAVGPSRPRLARTDAERVAKGIFKGYSVPGRVEYTLDPSRTSLAWLEAEGTSEAVLIWRVTGTPKLLGGDWSKVPRATELYVDALSGALRERRRVR